MRSLLALYLMVRHLSSSPPTNIRKVRGRKKGMLVLILNASQKSTETRDELSTALVHAIQISYVKMPVESSLHHFLKNKQLKLQW